MKFNQDNIGHHLFNEEKSISHLDIHSDPKHTADDTNLNKERVVGFKTKLFAAIVFLILLTSLTVFGYQEYKAYKLESSYYYIPQPFTQKFQFREDTLRNGLKALYIKLNENKDKVYIALAVGIASESDPPHFRGFTHLLEHLLFTGSRNYPEDNYIEKVVNKYHGNNNGGTGDFVTTYYYEISAEGLDEFLKVLVDAVQNPILAVDTIKKEVNNVNSEISMRMTYEKTYGYYKFVKAVGNVDARIFSDGFANIDPKTIDFDQLQKDLIEVHSKFYSANIMQLVIMGDRDLDDVASIAKDNFAKLPNNGVERPLFNDRKSYIQPFTTETLGSVFYMQGLTEPSSLKLITPIPSFRTERTFLPTDFFRILFHYFAEGSLKLKLLEENLITSIGCYTLMEDYVDSIFIVNFDLTEKGRNNVSRVLQHYFNFIEYLKSMDNRKEIYRSISEISKFGFLFNVSNSKLGFSEEGDDYFSTVESFAGKLLDFQLDDLFRAGNVFEEYDDGRFVDLLSKFTLNNAVTLIESTGYKNIKNDYTKGDKPQPPSPNQDEVNPKPQTSAGTNNITFIDKNKITKMYEPTPAEAQTIKRLLAELTQPVEVIEETVTVEETIDEELLIEEYLDTAVEKVTLDKNFDFDNNRAYTRRKMPAKLLDAISSRAANNQTPYVTLSPINTSFMDNYNMITRCDAPVQLQDSFSNLSAPIAAKSFALLDKEAKRTRNSFSPSNNLSTKYLNTGKTYDLIFTPKNNQMDKTVHGSLGELDGYKDCLRSEFDADTKDTRLEVLESQEYTALWYKLFRMSLQPKFISMFIVEAEELFNKIIINRETSIKAVLQLEMLCEYIEDHIELVFPDDYVAGSNFHCRRTNFGLLFVFSGLTSNMEIFSIKVFDYVFSLTNPAMYKNILLNNIRKRVLNGFSNFGVKSAKSLSMYYLDYAIDKLHMDYSTEETASYLREIVEDTNGDQLSLLIGDLHRNIKVTVFNAGNVTKEVSFNMFSHVDQMYTRKNSGLNEFLANPRLRKDVQAKLALEIGVNEHKVLRLPNNDGKESNSVYVSFFKFGMLGRKEYLYLKVLVHYLKDKVFNKLRNELNLGYIATAFAVDYHYVS